MNDLAPLLLDGRAGGLYRWLAPLKPATVAEAIETHGWRFFYLDGRQARDKASFLHSAAAAMSFPDDAGRNWDAFEECLNDLAWARAPGYVLLYDFVWWLACGQPESWQTARAIMTEACAQWARAGTPFLVLLRHTHGCSGVAATLAMPRPHHLPLRRRFR